MAEQRPGLPDEIGAGENGGALEDWEVDFETAQEEAKEKMRKLILFLGVPLLLRGLIK